MFFPVCDHNIRRTEVIWTHPHNSQPETIKLQTNKTNIIARNGRTYSNKQISFQNISHTTAQSPSWASFPTAASWLPILSVHRILLHRLKRRNLNYRQRKVENLTRGARSIHLERGRRHAYRNLRRRWTFWGNGRLIERQMSGWT